MSKCSLRKFWKYINTFNHTKKVESDLCTFACMHCFVKHLSNVSNTFHGGFNPSHYKQFRDEHEHVDRLEAMFTTDE